MNQTPLDFSNTDRLENISNSTVKCYTSPNIHVAYSTKILPIYYEYNTV